MTAVDRAGMAGVVPQGLGEQVAMLRAADVLEPADVHVAEAIGRLTGEADEQVLLAVALAVRAPRLGHVCLDLRRLHEVGVSPEGGERVAVSLPALDSWLRALGSSPATRGPTDAAQVTPLVLDEHRLYLDRYWRYEQRLVARLRALAQVRPAAPEQDRLAEVLDRLFPVAEDAVQRRAAELAATRAFTVLTGGPGTGKTTTLVRILATLWLAGQDGRAPRAVLAAPTGKAAARMSEAVRGSVAQLDVPGDVRTALEELPALTVHRLLGYRPDAPTRFRHDAANPLPYDVVVLDEASMASLPLMAKLTDALPEGARLVLIGDRDQLASVDAGAVLSDICGPESAGTSAEAPPQSASAPIGDAIVRLTRSHRFGADSGIGAVARAIRRLGATEGSSDDVIASLQGEPVEDGGPTRYDDVALVEPGDGADGGLPAAVLDEVVQAYAQPVGLAQQGAPPLEVLAAFDRVRVLAALRHGPEGVIAIDRAIAGGLRRVVPGFEAGERFPVGQLLMVTRNDHRLGLYNGDVGVVVRDDDDPDRRRVAFPATGGEVRRLAPTRLPDVESVFAMSIHKSQGSQFDRVVVVLPRREVPLLTRELVYTGVTRAREHVTVVATPSVLIDALQRRVQRASGLTARLWGTG